MTTEETPSTSQEISTKSGVRDSFWDLVSLASGNIVLIPLGLVSSALTTRILGREGYGQIALFGMVTGIVFLMTSNWTSAAVLRFGREEYDSTGKLHRTFWARNAILIPCLVLGCVVVFLFRSEITAYLEMPLWTVWLVMVAVLIGSARSYLEYVLQAIHRMKVYAVIQVLVSVISIAGFVLTFVGVFERKYLTIIAIGLVAAAAVTGFLILLLIPVRLFLPAKTNREALREIFLFSYPIIAGNVAAYVVQWIDTLVIKHYFTLADVGGYQLAYNVFNLVAGWLGSITTLMTPMLISFVAANRNDLITRYSTRLVPQALLLWSTAVGVGIGLAPMAFVAVYGEEFGISAIYFQVLVFGLAVNFLSYLYSGAITAYKLIKLSMLASVATALVNLVLDFLLVPHIGPLGATLASTAGITVAAVAYLLICQRQLQRGLLWQLGLVLPALLSLGVCRLVPTPWSFFLVVFVSLITSYFLAKALRLFQVEDITFLDYIKMPLWVKRGAARVYTFMAS